MKTKIQKLIKKGYSIQEMAYRLNISIENITFAVQQNTKLSNSFIDESGRCILKNEPSMENYFYGELNEVIHELYHNIKITYYPTLEKFTNSNDEENIFVLKQKYKEIKIEYKNYLKGVEILKSLDDAELYAEKLKNYYYYFKNFKVNA